MSAPNVPLGSRRFDVAWESDNGYRLVMSSNRLDGAYRGVSDYLRRHNRTVVILELRAGGPDRIVAGRYARKWPWWPFWVVAV